VGQKITLKGETFACGDFSTGTPEGWELGWVLVLSSVFDLQNVHQVI